MTGAPDDPPAAKFFPRNLTAHADSRVLGNPASSRPESGVDNAYPGLEYDTRNLERIFFPGLQFTFHRSDGARLVDADPALAAACGLGVLAGPAGIYLWAVLQPGPAGVVTTDCDGFNGMRVWQVARALDRGPVALMLGAGPRRGADRALAEPVAARLFAGPSPGGPPQGQLVEGEGHAGFVVLAGLRSPYLDGSGVVDPDRLPAGELTQTMCAPWMYDFRDCFCFYWASNKPDMVDAAAGNPIPVNFLRRNRAASPDVARWEGREDTAMTYADMAAGMWQSLPVVLSDRESDTAVARVRTGDPRDFTRASLAETLARLAGVEHALVVEYLFARSTLGCPPDAEPALLAAVELARREIFEIAKDEMRHFLWVNRMLQVMGARPATARARFLEESPGQGPEPHASLVRPFALRPLDRPTLQEFIDLERPSRQIGKGLDGMYVHILDWLEHRAAGILPERDEVVPIVKLIVDEGEGHWQRLLAIQAALAPFAEAGYLVPLGAPKTEDDRHYAALADLYYNAVLDALDASFTVSGITRTDLMAGSVRSMQNLDEVMSVLQARGVALRFAIEPNGTATPTRAAAAAKADRRAQQVASRLGSISGIGPHHVDLAGQAARDRARHLHISGLLADTGQG